MKTPTSTICFSSRRRGFTIVEILLVAAIIALLAGAAGGLYVGTYRKMLVEKSARELVLAAKYARLVAVEKQQPSRLVLDGQNNTFYVTCPQMDIATGQPEQTIMRNEYSRPVQLPESVSFEHIDIRTASAGQSTENNAILFFPDGAADAAAVQVGNGEKHYSVFISAATGRATIVFGRAEDREQRDVIDLDYKR